MTSRVIEGHIEPCSCLILSSTFIYEPIFMKILLNAYFMKTQIFSKKFERGFVIVLTSLPPDLSSYGQLVSLFSLFFGLNEIKIKV